MVSPSILALVARITSLIEFFLTRLTNESINKPFPELLIDSWCKLDTSAQREYQFVGVTNNDKDDYEDVSYLLKSMKGNNNRYDDKFEWLDVENMSRQVS